MNATQLKRQYGRKWVINYKEDNTILVGDVNNKRDLLYKNGDLVLVADDITYRPKQGIIETKTGNIIKLYTCKLVQIVTASEITRCASFAMGTIIYKYYNDKDKVLLSIAY